MYSDILNWAEKMDEMHGIERCENCGCRVESDELTYGLCSECQNEINNDELIGWRKGE